MSSMALLLACGIVFPLGPLSWVLTLLLLLALWRAAPELNDETAEAILLIDIRNSKPFAVYRNGGACPFRRVAIDIFRR